MEITIPTVITEKFKISINHLIEKKYENALRIYKRIIQV